MAARTSSSSALRRRRRRRSQRGGPTRRARRSRRLRNARQGHGHRAQVPVCSRTVHRSHRCTVCATGECPHQPPDAIGRASSRGLLRQHQRRDRRAGGRRAGAAAAPAAEGGWCRCQPRGAAGGEQHRLSGVRGHVHGTWAGAGHGHGHGQGTGAAHGHGHGDAGLTVFSRRGGVERALRQRLHRCRLESGATAWQRHTAWIWTSCVRRGYCWCGRGRAAPHAVRMRWVEHGTAYTGSVCRGWQLARHVQCLSKLGVRHERRAP